MSKFLNELPIIREFREMMDDITRPVRALDRAVGHALLTTANRIISPVVHMDMMAHLKKMPQGKALLQEARDNKVPISFFYTQGHWDGSYGGPQGQAPAIALRNTAQPLQMAGMLYHELWHMHQHNEMGSRPMAYKMADAKTALFNTLVIEADAYTQQAIATPMPRRQDGFETILWDRRPRDNLHDFFHKNPKDSFADRAQMSRAFFSNHLSLLGIYRAAAYIDIVTALESAPTRADFLRQQQALPAAEVLAPTQPLKDNYGAGFTGTLDMRAMKSEVMRMLTMPERKFLQMAENIGRNAPKMTDAEFNAARAAMKPQLQQALDHAGIISSSSKDFARVQKQRDALNLVARQNIPPAAANLRHHAAKALTGQAAMLTGLRAPASAARTPLAPRR